MAPTGWGHLLTAQCAAAAAPTMRRAHRARSTGITNQQRGTRPGTCVPWKGPRRTSLQCVLVSYLNPFGNPVSVGPTECTVGPLNAPSVGPADVSVQKCTRFLNYIIRGKTGYTHSLSPSRPPNNTLNTRQQRTQVQGHISHTRARADRRAPQMLRVRSGRGRHFTITSTP